MASATLKQTESHFQPSKQAEEAFQSEVVSPFDGALEVGLAHCAVVHEYRRAGAELFRQSSRGDLRVTRSLRGNRAEICAHGASRSVCRRLRGSCDCFSSSPALKYKEETRWEVSEENCNMSGRGSPTVRLRLVEEQSAGSGVVRRVGFLGQF